MNRLKPAAGIVLVLLVGVLGGALGTGIYYKHRMERFVAGGPPIRTRTNLLIARLSKKLDLTETQRSELEKIVKASQEKIFTIRRKVLPEIAEITEESFSQMAENLNPGQKIKLEKLRKRFKYRHARAFIRSMQIGKTREQVYSTLKKRLNLTDEQEKKVLPVLEQNILERRKIIRKYRDRDRPDLYSMRNEMRNLQVSLEERLTPIFTEQQMKEFLKMQKEKRLEMRSEKIRSKKAF